MRNTPDYRAAVHELAVVSESGSLPSFEIENQAAAIAASFSVTDTDVRDDVAEAARRHVAAQEPAERFFFLDAHGERREVYVLEGSFYCVCVDGTQVGPSYGTPEAAGKAMDALVADGVHSTLITVEAYRQTSADAEIIPAIPFFQRGCWSADLRLAA